MNEVKKIPGKEIDNHFSKERDTSNMSSNNQFTEQFSFDLFNKADSYIPVILINPNNDDVAHSIEISRQAYLSKSNENRDIEKSRNANLLQLLLKNPVTNKQATDNVLKFQAKRKTRLLVKRGVSYISLLLVDIPLICTKDKLVYVIDRESKKYLVDKTLSELHQSLDPAIFFRANRQYIVNVNYIKGFKPYEKVKLLVDVNVHEFEEPVIISQEMAPVFKKWINNV